MKTLIKLLLITFAALVTSCGDIKDEPINPNVTESNSLTTNYINGEKVINTYIPTIDELDGTEWELTKSGTIIQSGLSIFEYLEVGKVSEPVYIKLYRLDPVYDYLFESVDGAFESFAGTYNINDSTSTFELSSIFYDKINNIVHELAIEHTIIETTNSIYVFALYYRDGLPVRYYLAIKI